MKKKSMVILGIIIILVIVGVAAFVISKINLSKVEKEALINVEALYYSKDKANDVVNNAKNLLSGLSGQKAEIEENDLRIIEIKKIDEKKLLKVFGRNLDRSGIKNESNYYYDENGNYRKKEDTTDYTKYSFFAIKYYYQDEIHIAIYIGGYMYNSTEYLRTGSWVRDIWDMDVYTIDKINIEKILKKMKE